MNTAKKAITFFENKPCYEEAKKLIKSHKLFECETDGFLYDGFVQENNDDGYFYVVKKRIQHGK